MKAFLTSVLVILLLSLCLGSAWAEPMTRRELSLQLTQLEAELEAIEHAGPTVQQLITHDFTLDKSLVTRLDKLIAQLEKLETITGPWFAGFHWVGDLSLLPPALRNADPNDPEVRKQFKDELKPKLRAEHGGKSPVSCAMSMPGVRVGLVLAHYERGLLTDNVDDLKYVIDNTSSGRLYILSHLGLQARNRLLLLARRGTAKAPEPVVMLGQRLLPTLVKQDEVMIPVHYFWKGPAKVQWDPVHKRATIQLAEGTFELGAGSLQAIAQGRRVELTAPPLLKDGHLLISVRDVKPLFGLDYKWDSRLRAVWIFPPNHSS